MTTNYTHILNENLDMFSGYDYPADMVELADGSLVTWEEIWADDYYDDYYTYDYMNESLSDYLDELERQMAEIVERCGVYGAEEWAELAFIYSDVYKDLYGMRPSYGLFYHGFTIRT